MIPVRHAAISVLTVLLAVVATAQAVGPVLPCPGVAGMLRAGLDAEARDGLQDASAGAAFAIPHLHPIEPDPFDPRATLRFDVPRAAEISLRVYDLRGRVIERIVEGRIEAGRHTRVWAPDEDLPSGVYLVRLDADRHVLVRKAMLAR